MQPASELWPCRARCWSGRSRSRCRPTSIYAGAVSAAARDQAAADALLAALHGPDKAALLKQTGWSCLSGSWILRLKLERAIRGRSRGLAD